MARLAKRVGYGPNKGALNAKVTTGVVKPSTPKAGAVHLNFEKGEVSKYDGSAWFDLNLLYVGSSAPANVNLLWFDTTTKTIKTYTSGSWS